MIESTYQNLDKPKFLPHLIQEVICINLATRTDRRVQVVKDFPYQFRFFTAQPHPTSGKQGCTDSHYAVVAWAKAQNLENVMIIEDDVFFLYDPANLPTVPSDWDLLMFGGLCTTISGVWHQPWTQGQFVCAHAYVVPSKSYDFILQNIDVSKGAEVCFDAQLAENFMGKHKAWMVTKQMIGQREDYSDLDLRVKWKNYEWLPVGSMNRMP